MSWSVPPETLRPLVTLAACSTAAWLICRAAARSLRRSSPATRHLAWLLAFVMLAACAPVAFVHWRFQWEVLPPAPVQVGVEKLAVPRVPVVHSESSVESVPQPVTPALGVETDVPKTPTKGSFDFAALARLIPLGWGLGVLLLLGSYLGTAGRLTGVRRRGTLVSAEMTLSTLLAELSEGAGVRRRVPLYLSSEVKVPLVAGVLRPAIILPEAAAGWPRNQIRAVFLHELAHLMRCDLASLMFGRVVLAIYWFNPLVWSALSNLRSEAEQAADDEASHRYEVSADYASDLVAVVRELRAAKMNLLLAIGVDSRVSLEGRIRRLLDSARNCRVPSWRRCAGLIVAAALAALMVMLVRPVAAKEKPKVGETVETSRGLKKQSEPLVVRCEDENGKPVSGAEVYLTETLEKRRLMYQISYHIPWTHPQVMKTNEAGEATFSGLLTDEDGGYGRLVYARAAGKLVGGNGAFKTGKEESGSATSMVVKMQPSGPLRGKVTLQGGGSPEGARVSLLTWLIKNDGGVFGYIGDAKQNPWPELTERDVDAKGNFEFADIPLKATTYLSASAPGYGWTQTMVFPDRPSPEVSLLLEKEAIIEGRLTAAEDGKPVAGVEIKVTPTHSAVCLIPYETTTNSEGHFRATGLHEGSYAISLAWSDERTMQQANVVARPGESTQVNLKTEKKNRVEGKVFVGAERKPVAGVMISAVSGDVGGEGLDSSVTDANGRYSLGLPSGKTMVYISAQTAGATAGLKDQGRRTLTLKDGKIVDGSPEFALEEAPKEAQAAKTEKASAEAKSQSVRAHGRVLDQGGKPLGGVIVSRSLKPLPGSIFPGTISGPIGETAADGTYEVNLYPYCEYQIKAGGVIQSTATSKAFKTVPGSEHAIEDLVLRPATAGASGTVVDEAGRPLANVEINPNSKNKYVWKANEAVTDENGHFVLANLMDDENFSVQVLKSGYVSRFIHGIPPGTEDFQVVLSRMESNFVNKIERLPDGERLVGKPTPELEVSNWIQKEGAPPTLKRSDGRWTLLHFMTDGDGMGERLTQLDEMVRTMKVSPVVVFDCDTDEHYPRALLKQLPNVTFPIGIDHFRPDRSTWSGFGATRMAFGNDQYYVIDSNGMVRAVKRSLKDVKEFISKAQNAP